MKKFYTHYFLTQFLSGLFLIFCFQGNAQTLRGFGNYSMFTNESKEKIKEIQGGIDYVSYPIALQVSLSYINNVNRYQENYDYDNYVLESLTTKASAINLGTGLKIYNLFLEEDDFSDLAYYIMPKLNVAQISGKENFSSSSYLSPSESFSQGRTAVSWQVYFGIEFGYEFFLSQNNFNSIAISVNYSRLNLGKPLSKLPYNNFDYSKHDNFGLGVYFFLDLKKKFNGKK